MKKVSVVLFVGIVFLCCVKAEKYFQITPHNQFVHVPVFPSTVERHAVKKMRRPNEIGIDTFHVVGQYQTK